MSVANGQLANQTTFNNAFMSRTAAQTSTVAEINLANPGSDEIEDAQKFINDIATASGFLEESDETINEYGSENYIADGDSFKIAIGKLDVALDAVMTNLQAQIDGIFEGVRSFDDGLNVGKLFSLEGFGFNSTTDDSNIYTDPIMIDASFYEVQNPALTTIPSGGLNALDRNGFIVFRNMTGGTLRLEDGTESGLYERFIAGGNVFIPDQSSVILYYDVIERAWYVFGSGGASSPPVTYNDDYVDSTHKTLEYHIQNAPVQTMFVKSKTGQGAITLDTYIFGAIPLGPQDGSKITLIGMSDTDYVVIPMSNTDLGVVGNFTSIALKKDVAVTLVRRDRYAGPTQYTDDRYVLETVWHASSTKDGIVSTGTQTFAGAKTFSNKITGSAGVDTTDLTFTGTLIGDAEIDSSSTGTDQTLTTPTKMIRKFSGALVSVAGIVVSTVYKRVILTNNRGSSTTIKNESSAASSSFYRILTGTGSDLILENGASIELYYDNNSSRWRVVGGPGGGSSMVFTASQLIASGATVASLSTTAEVQHLLVASTGGDVDLSITPFGGSAPTKVRRVTLTGTSDDDPVNITFNDADYGCVGNFSRISLGKFKSVTFDYNPQNTRWQYVAGALA